MKKLLAVALGAAFAWLQLNGTPAQWIERAQRFPLPALRAARPAVPTAPAESVRAQTLEQREYPGEVVALVESGEALYAGTFDQGVFRDQARLAVDLRVNDLALGEDGTLYAATNGGAFADERRLAAGAFSSVAIWNGAAVFASRNGISRVEGADFHTLQGTRAEMPSALTSCGALLCIGASNGVWLFDGERSLHRSAPEEMVTAVAFDGSQVWAGTMASGIARFPGLVPVLPDNRVSPHALLVKDGTVYAGTPGGLLILRGGRTRIARELGPVSAIAASSRGGIWVGAGKRALRVETQEALVMR